MDSWLTLLIIIIVLAIVIGNFSTFHKSAKQPMRKQGLNDLKETLPRSQKTPHQMNTGSKDQEKEN